MKKNTAKSREQRANERITKRARELKWCISCRSVVLLLLLPPPLLVLAVEIVEEAIVWKSNSSELLSVDMFG